MDVLEYIRSNPVALPQLTKFALGMVFLFGVLALSPRLRIPAVVGLLFTSTFERGLSPSGLALQLIEIAAFVPLLLLDLGRGGRYLLKHVVGDEQECFILMSGSWRAPSP